MRAWGGGRHERVATAVSRVLAKSLGWKSPYFLPEDMAEVAFHGPSFDFTDPEAAFDDVVEMLRDEYNFHGSDEFWRCQKSLTMGRLVENLLAEMTPVETDVLVANNSGLS